MTHISWDGSNMIFQNGREIYGKLMNDIEHTFTVVNFNFFFNSGIFVSIEDGALNFQRFYWIIVFFLLIIICNLNIIFNHTL